MVTTIRARYQNGVLKPLEPLDLPENQVVEIHIEPTEQPAGEVVKLGGAWAQYFPDGDTLSFEEIQRITRDKGE
jgi:predicted DNA-binding antitoxin AbrB/MazE fold protein